MHLNTYNDALGRISVQPVCYMQTSLEGVDMPIAIRLKIDPSKMLAYWEDTGRGHSIRVQGYRIGDDIIEISAKDGSQWKFTPLTKEIFENIKSSLEPLSKELKNDEEIQSYYLQTNFSI